MLTTILAYSINKKTKTQQNYLDKNNLNENNKFSKKKKKLTAPTRSGLLEIPDRSNIRLGRQDI